MIIRYIRDSYFDSLLDTSHVSSTTNANLYLIIRIHLNKINPRSGSTETINHGLERNLEIARWSSNEWETFKRDFVNVCYEAWNNKVWLISNDYWGCDYPLNAPSPTYRPHVRCMLRIDLVNSSEGAHLSCNCVKPAAPVVFSRSSMNRTTHRGSLDIYDVQMQNEIHSNWKAQVPAAHELGHYLGLSHVGGRGNESTRYSSSFTARTSSEYSYGDIMGGGMRVEEWHARPWLNRIARHIGHVRRGTPDWGVGESRWQFTPSRHRQPPQRIPSYMIYRRPGFQDLDGGVPLPAGVPMPGGVGGE